MLNLKKILVFNIVICSLVFSEEIQNTLILDNPDRPVTTVETMKKRDKAELNLSIKKISSFSIDGYINKKNRLISFYLDELGLEDNFFLVSNKEFYNLETKKIKEHLSDYEIEKIDYTNKIIVFKYDVLPKELYLVKYDKKSKNLKKLYTWQERDAKYIDTQNGDFQILFTENYKPFEIVRFSLNNKNSPKGELVIRNGSYLKIDSHLAKEISIRNRSGVTIETISLKNGKGSFGLDESKRGLILENGSSILNLGIGFKNDEILLQIKGTTDSSKEYILGLNIFNLDGSIQTYNVGIRPAQYSFKILSNTLNFEFNNTLKESKETQNPDLISKGEIVIDSKDLNIKVGLKNNGLFKLRSGENILNGKLEIFQNNELSKNRIKTYQVIGKVNKREANSMPDGNYTGDIELIIVIDS